MSEQIKNLKPPKYLSFLEKRKFRKLAKYLSEIGVEISEEISADEVRDYLAEVIVTFFGYKEIKKASQNTLKKIKKHPPGKTNYQRGEMILSLKKTKKSCNKVMSDLKKSLNLNESDLKKVGLYMSVDEEMEAYKSVKN